MTGGEIMFPLNEYIKTLSCGDILYDKGSKIYYIIAQVDWAKINLISLVDGNRYHISDVSITNTKNIPFANIRELIGDWSILDFYYVGDATDVLTFGDDKINHKFSIEQCGAIKYILRNGQRITRGHHDFYIRDGCIFGKLGADGFNKNKQMHESELITFWNKDRWYKKIRRLKYDNNNH